MRLLIWGSLIAEAGPLADFLGVPDGDHAIRAEHTRLRHESSVV